MTEKKYRASVIRDDGTDEDWGYFDLRVSDGTLALRCNEATDRGCFDHFLAPGTWREVRDAHPEE